MHNNDHQQAFQESHLQHNIYLTASHQMDKLKRKLKTSAKSYFSLSKKSFLKSELIPKEKKLKQINLFRKEII